MKYYLCAVLVCLLVANAIAFDSDSFLEEALKAPSCNDLCKVKTADAACKNDKTCSWKPKAKTCGCKVGFAKFSADDDSDSLVQVPDFLEEFEALKAPSCNDLCKVKTADAACKNDKTCSWKPKAKTCGCKVGFAKFSADDDSDSLVQVKAPCACNGKVKNKCKGIIKGAQCVWKPKEKTVTKKCACK